MGGEHQRVLGVHVGRLELGPPAPAAQPTGEHLRRPPFGIRAGPAPLVRAELLDQLLALRRVHLALCHSARRNGGKRSVTSTNAYPVTGLVQRPTATR